MKALALLLLLGALATPAMATGVDDVGEALLRGRATDLVERVVRLDLWDQGDPARSYNLRIAPDSDVRQGVEARARPVHGAWGAWNPAEGFEVRAGPDPRAEDRGWDGLHDIGLRVRLPNVEASRLGVLLVEAKPGDAAYAFTTRLEVAVLRFDARVEGEGLDRWLVADLAGGKAPAGVEAAAGAQRWPLAAAGGAWRVRVPEGIAEVRLVARFADGGVLEGPMVRIAHDGAPAPASSAGEAPEPGAEGVPPEKRPATPPVQPVQRLEPLGSPAPRAARDAALSEPSPAPAPPAPARLLGVPAWQVPLAALALVLVAVCSRRERPPSL